MGRVVATLLTQSALCVLLLRMEGLALEGAIGPPPASGGCRTLPKTGPLGPWSPFALAYLSWWADGSRPPRWAPLLAGVWWVWPRVAPCRDGVGGQGLGGRSPSFCPALATHPHMAQPHQGDTSIQLPPRDFPVFTPVKKLASHGAPGLPMPMPLGAIRVKFPF